MIENRRIALDEVESGNYYKNCQFNYSSNNLHFTEVIFESCEFQQTDFKKSEWIDCQFIDLNLSNYIFTDSIFYRCEFEKCQLTGVDFSKNKWKDNIIVESKAEYLSLDSSSIENCNFHTTQLSDSFFQAVKIKKGLRYKECNLENADFMDTYLNGVDFSKSYFDMLTVSANLIKGCIINTFQSTQFVSLLGVTVKDD